MSPSSVEQYEAPPDGWRTFLILWFTQSLSVFGSALTFFAINIWLTKTLYPDPAQQKELARALSLVGIAFAVPTVFIGPIAGAWADRHDRRKIMLAADILNGLLMIGMVMLMASGRLQLWEVVGVTFLLSTISVFHFAGFDTSYAMLVPEERLPRANGMMQTIWALSGVLSQPLAALFISLPNLAREGRITGSVGQWLATMADGSPLAIGVDAASFFFAALVIAMLRIPSPQRSDLHESTGEKPSLWADIRQGISFIWVRRPLFWLLATFAVSNFASTSQGVFMPIVVRDRLAESWQALGFSFETALALLGSFGGIGGIIGGFLISTWGGLKRKRVLGVVIPIMLSAVAMTVFGWSRELYLTAIAGGIISGLIPFMNTHSQTIWQTQTPREMQGRVFSVRRVIAQFTWPLGTVFMGFVGGRFDPGTVIAVMGLLTIGFCILQLFNRQLMTLEESPLLIPVAPVVEEPVTG